MNWFSPPPPPPPATFTDLLSEAIADPVAFYRGREPELHAAASLIMIVTGVAVIVVELGLEQRAAYGRYASQPSAAQISER